MKIKNFLKISILSILLLSSFFGFAQYTSIPDPAFEKALIDFGLDSGPIDNRVLTANIAGVQSLNISGKGCINLTGIEDFTALKELYCLQNPLFNLDLSKNTALTKLSCGNSLLSSLNISNNIALTELDCQNSRITSLDLSKNTELTKLLCNTNQITSLDLSKNTKLTFVQCNDNQIVNLNVPANPALVHLSCNNNQISTFNINSCIALTDLDCSFNRLSSLNVSNNTALINMYCNNNQIVDLDVTKNIALVRMLCNNNQLKKLNLKNDRNIYLMLGDFKFNSNLSCIDVDDDNYSNTNWLNYKDADALYSRNCSRLLNKAPILKATGDQTYCPGSEIKIVETFSIDYDINETGTQSGFIQISSGYSTGDILSLSNPSMHPLIKTSWDSETGKLTLSSVAGVEILYTDLEAAIKDIVFSNPSTTISGVKTFSITIGQANYLPSTGHYYLFVPSLGISWGAAKVAAENLTYYGLTGYLATILAEDEAKLIGEQASGTGWIGGSDAETEGVWKWVTGPEAGTIFWNGTANGSSPNFAYWNSGEPNQSGDEDYAHITEPGVGIKGSWNDLSNSGDISGSYQPKGYVVEFGGMPGENALEIAASTKITIPLATPIIPNPKCDSGSFELSATATSGATINWYDAQTGGNLLGTGTTYNTPVISTTTTYYVDAGCEINRKAVTATINITPNDPTAADQSRCGDGSVTFQATSNIGIINWFTTATGGSSIFTGANFTTPSLSENTTYYIQASNNGCINPNRVPVNAIIYTPPTVSDESLVLCESQIATLDAGIIGMSYLWSNGATTRTIDVNTAGIYTVAVTSPAPESCSSTKKITVIEHKKPIISRVDVEGTRAIIYLVKTEDYYEYSVDGEIFQDSNIFYDLPGGLQMAYVREKNKNCGNDSKLFVVLVFPPFFTPNNDTHNDVWEVTGLENYPQAQVTIFDRYGKLVAQLNNSNMSWDGNLNQIPLPSSDYWYALKIDDTMPILRGHFTLKR